MLHGTLVWSVTTVPVLKMRPKTMFRLGGASWSIMTFTFYSRWKQSKVCCCYYYYLKMYLVSYLIEL